MYIYIYVHVPLHYLIALWHYWCRRKVCHQHKTVFSMDWIVLVSLKILRKFYLFSLTLTIKISYRAKYQVVALYIFICMVVFKPSWSQIFLHPRKSNFINSWSLIFILFLTAIWTTDHISGYNFLYLPYCHNFCSLFLFLRYCVKYFWKLTSSTHVGFYNIQHSVRSLCYSFYISYIMFFIWGETFISLNSWYKNSC